MSEQHHHPNYKKIYITLVILLAISVAGPHLGIVWLTLITAFGIALVKANLVVQNFMIRFSHFRCMKFCTTRFAFTNATPKAVMRVSQKIPRCGPATLIARRTTRAM